MSKSKEIKSTDGRKYAKRLAPKPISTKDKQVKAPRSTKAKKDRVESYAINALKQVFGGEKEAFIHMAELGKKNFSQMQLLMQYAYGRPNDKVGGDTVGRKNSQPVINFNLNNPLEPKQIDNTFEIIHEEEE